MSRNCPTYRGRPQKKVQVIEVIHGKLLVGYLGDMLSAAGGRELSTAHVKTAWKKFKGCWVSYKTRDCVYSSCFQNAMLHISETWPLTRPDLQRLGRNDRAMIRQNCNVKLENVVTVRSKKLLAQLEIDYVVVIRREEKLCLFVHVERFSGAIKTVCDMQIGKRGPGRAKMTWMTLKERDLREWKLKEFDPCDRGV